MDVIMSRFVFGPVVLLYISDGQGHLGFSIVPRDKESDICEKVYRIEPLVQVHISGDPVSGGFSNGHSMSGSASTYGFTYVSQENMANQVITLLADPKGRKIRHIVEYQEGWEAVTVKSEFINDGEDTVRLELLSSFCLGGISPFEPDDAPCTLVRHCIKSAWSAEGRVLSDPIERLNLEPSWSGAGIRIEKIGQVGSMPVRGYFPFTAVEDVKHSVTWAVQIACNSTWQIELKRRDNALSMTGGLGDFDFGHWAKDIAPGESFTTPEAFVTAVSGTLDDACISLLTVQKSKNEMQLNTLPLLFNEFCTTWGVPSDENISKIIGILKGKGYDCLVLDAGWYIDDIHEWSEINGDWNVSPRLFPNGIGSVVDKIHAAGMKAGLWFELETCGSQAEISKRKDLLLHRNGHAIDVRGKFFLDMQNEDALAYLEEKVIGLLKKHSFDYIKVDYNDSIGVGCDGAESLGEGLRRNMQASIRFFRKMREAIPDLMIENCSSGGHRLEPSMMQVTTMASFSDAHECAEIPVIAANLHRVILPGQSQIWAVMRAGDSIKRITYSLTAAMLGVMCLSGDIYDLNEQQQKQIDLGTHFYKQVAHIIRDGRSEIFTEDIKSYRHLKGWQAVKRTADSKDEILVIAHCFENGGSTEITVNVDAEFTVASIFTDDSVKISKEKDKLIIWMPEDFSSAAIWLKMP